MTEIDRLSAVELRHRIAAGRVSASDALEAAADRIALRNPAVNAMVTLCLDRARQEAGAADDAVAAGRKLGPLHGVPFAVKDLNETEGVRTTWGSLEYKDHVPRRDCGLVARMRAAGAILVGKSNTPEFGAGANTRNAVFGATVNPLDTTRTCAGSSGGSAVALATRMVPLATGSDTGGSLRVPAAFSGVVGVRPTPGLVADEGRGNGWTTFAVEGPMARTVGDAALMLSVLAADDPRDPMAGPVDRRDLADARPADLNALRVAASADLGIAPVDDDIRAAFDGAVDALAPAVASVRRTDPPLADAHRVFDVLRAQAFVGSYKAIYDRNPDALGPNVRTNVEMGLSMTLVDAADAHARHVRLYRRFVDFLDDHDVLICPAAPVSPFPVDEWYPAAVGGQAMDVYYRWIALAYALTLTAHPVVVVPCGTDRHGLPFGIQICGKRGRDADVLRIAAAIEARFATVTGFAPARAAEDV
ncbi:amidase [Fodinicurvata sp. EGI_FJ10296]|uniref:amidase n=1 Tax=Fodinicurvata sp. EGI_FJ10296 TaxID=3231908 RepID=UPI003456CB3A